MIFSLLKAIIIRNPSTIQIIPVWDPQHHLRDHPFPSYGWISGFSQITQHCRLFYWIFTIYPHLSSYLDPFLHRDMGVELEHFCLFALSQTLWHTTKYFKSNKTWKTGPLLSSHFLNQKTALYKFHDSPKCL